MFDVPMDSSNRNTVINHESPSMKELNENNMLGGTTPISSDQSFTTHFAGRSYIQENLHSLAISTPLEYSNDFLSSSTFPFADDSEYNRLLGNVYDKFPFPPQFGGETSQRPKFEDLNHQAVWISPDVIPDYPYGFSTCSNELSLSLDTSRQSVISGANISDQCSEMSCSGETSCCLNATRSRLDSSSGQFSRFVIGSGYVHAVQEILGQIMSYSVGSFEETSCGNGGGGGGGRHGGNVPFSSARKGRVPAGGDGAFEIQRDPENLRRAEEAKKTELLSLLEVVDERYNQCLEAVHTVVSAFHAATELDPQMHARFALQTVSLLYKSIRERISNCILATTGPHSNTRGPQEMEKSFENSFIQEQWALQQLKRKNQQLWKPQRGLPERSVSVLRAWMFQNFLHPYPKDAEKHLLAVKSGLTRSQVSNWFINARVRLWKPMIEEMYAEMNRTKARRNDDGKREITETKYSSIIKDLM